MTSSVCNLISGNPCKRFAEVMQKGQKEGKMKPKDVTGFLKEKNMERTRLEMLGKLDDEGHLDY